MNWIVTGYMHEKHVAVGKTGFDVQPERDIMIEALEGLIEVCDAQAWLDSLPFRWNHVWASAMKFVNEYNAERERYAKSKEQTT